MGDTSLSLWQDPEGHVTLYLLSPTLSRVGELAQKSQR